MTKIDETIITPEDGKSTETKQSVIQKTTNDDVIKTMKDIPEEAKARIKAFLGRMGQTQRGKENGAKKIQREFCESDEFIRGSKDIIKKLWNIRYEDYSVWGDYMGIQTYNYDQCIIKYIIPELLNDKEFMLELIKDQPDICKYLGMSDLMQDKDFILKIIPIVRTNCLSSLYVNIPDNAGLREDKQIINTMLDAGGDSHTGSGGAILNFLVEKDSPLLDDREIMKKIVIQIGGYNRHKQIPKIRDDNEYLLLVYKSGGSGSFYTFDDNKDYYVELRKKAESLIKNNEQELIKNIEENPLKASTFKIDAIVDKIDAKILNDDVFVLKLLFADKDLYDKISHPKKYVLKNMANYLKQKSEKWSDAVCEGTVNINSQQGIMSYTCGTVKLGNICEYGNNVIVWYNGKEQKEHVVYRPARNDSSGDDRGLCFTKTKITNIGNYTDSVSITVEASSKEKTRIYGFHFPKTELPKETIPETEEQKESFLKIQQQINDSVQRFETCCDAYTSFCRSRSWGFRGTVNDILGMESACKSILDGLDTFKKENSESIGLFAELDYVRKTMFEKLTYLKKNVNPMTDSGGRLFDKWFSKEIFERFMDK
ncbi:MAG: hypothetical protein WCO66_01010 [Candidatus Absconditabacteria bacterium]